VDHFQFWVVNRLQPILCTIERAIVYDNYLELRVVLI